MITRCLIVDDEPLAIKLIENHIAKMESLTVIATCNSAMKAFEILNQNEVDLMFLDVKMPSMTGLDFLRTLKDPPKTVFTTAYREFAIDSYDLEVVDYLLKPITFERFFRSIDRFLRQRDPAHISTVGASEQEYIVLRSGVKYHKILLDTIVYIESTKDYISVHTVNGQAISSKYKIGTIEQELTDQRFLRVHRSFIINTSMISAFSIHDIDVGGTEVPIGASYKEPVLAFLETLKK